MSISVKEIAWIAGILEGEAWFGTSNTGSPSIYLRMTDNDIIERVRNLVDKSHTISISCDRRKEHYKDTYGFSINGIKAVEWMMIIYTLMSVRRKAKIKFCLDAWKNQTIYKTGANTPKAKAIAGFTRKLAALGYSETQISLARGMKKMGISDELVVEKISKLLM